jgi:replicative DNA helicase
MDGVLPSHKIEPIIFKYVITKESKYMNLLSKKYDVNWFEDSDIGKVLCACIRYFKKYNKIPTPDTVELLTSKIFEDKENSELIITKIKNIFVMSDTYDKEYIDAQILNYIINRGSYWSILDTVDNLESNNKLDKIQTCIEDMREIITMSFNDDLGTDYLEDIDKHIDDIMKPESTFSTGWSSIDKLTNGGIPTEGKILWLWIGESHIGKSLFLSNIAANLLRMDKFVVIVSLEMSEFVYSKRIDAHVTEADINSLNLQTKLIKQTADDIKKTNPNSKLLVKEYPPRSINTNIIRSYLDNVINTHKRKPDCILVDYLSLLLPNSGSKNDSTYTSVGRVAEELRSLSYVFGCTVFSVAQVQRSAYASTEVDLDNIAESMGIVNTADFIASIWQNEGDKEAGIIHNTILKNRLGGRIGKSVTYEIDYNNLTIKDADTFADAEDSQLSDMISDIEIDNSLDKL